LLILGAVAAAAVLYFSSGRGSIQPHFYSGTVLQGNDPAPPMLGMSLHDGTPVDITAYDGKVVMVYFGYTNCPDVCPDTLSAVVRALDDIGPEADKVQVLVVSVDPDRDTPESLEAYVDGFNPDFSGVTGSVSDTAVSASLYGVFHQASHIHGPDGEIIPDDVPPTPDLEDYGPYTIDHTSALIGIGLDGAMRIIWPPETTSENLSADLLALLDQ
jgi:protein SCO1/2